MKKLSDIIKESVINEEWRENEWDDIVTMMIYDVEDVDTLHWILDDVSDDELVDFCIQQRDKYKEMPGFNAFLNAVKRKDFEVISILHDVIMNRIDEIETGI